MRGDVGLKGANGVKETEAADHAVEGAEDGEPGAKAAFGVGGGVMVEVGRGGDVG